MLPTRGCISAISAVKKWKLYLTMDGFLVVVQIINYHAIAKKHAVDIKERFIHTEILINTNLESVWTVEVCRVHFVQMERNIIAGNQV
jgi:hypothetical protein